MEDFIKSDIFKHILCPKLSPLDLWKLKLTNKTNYTYIIYSMIRQSTLNNINLRLKIIFKDKYDEFRKVMDETKSVISGSFIIQCILGEYWNGSDIDIFSPLARKLKHKTFGKLEKFFYTDCKFECVEAHLIAKYQFGEDKAIIKYVDEYAYDKDDYNDNVLQVIKLDIKEDFNMICKFINNNTDFDICKNSYYIDNDVEYLNIYKLMDIFNKETLFNIGNSLGSSIIRCKKYRERGFNIINKMTYNQIAYKAKRDLRGLHIIDDVNAGIAKLYYIHKMNENRFKIMLNENFELQDIDYKIFVKNNMVIIENNPNKCPEDCLLCFCKSQQEHICFNNTYNMYNNIQYIFIIL